MSINYIIVVPDEFHSDSREMYSLIYKPLDNYGVDLNALEQFREMKPTLNNSWYVFALSEFQPISFVISLWENRTAVEDFKYVIMNEEELKRYDLI